MSAGPTELGFGRRDLDLRLVQPGQRVWKTDDPDLTRRLRQTFEGPSRRKVGVAIRVRAEVGEPIGIEATAANGAVAAVLGQEPLIVATNQPATAESLREQVDRFGGTIYELTEFTAAIDGGPLVPRSVLNGLRRELVVALDQAEIAPIRQIAAGPVLPSLRPSLPATSSLPHPTPELTVLCRTVPQIAAAVGFGSKTIYADFQDIKEYGAAVAAARAGEGVSLYLATPRIQKPGEGNIYRYLTRQGADGLLVRNAGGIAYCAERTIPFIADFAVNAANELAVAFFQGRGARRVTASYDLSFDQLDDLLQAVPTDWLEVVIHQQIPMFHMEFCAFSAHLSNGKPNPDCGRPCDHHDVKLRDRVGMEHPLKADVGCRNTLYNAVPQTAAEYLPRLLSRGVRYLRVEFLDDTPADVHRTLTLYTDAITGHRDPKTLWRDLKATGKYGVTRGALAIL